jgi:hypothetical protein
MHRSPDNQKDKNPDIESAITAKPRESDSGSEDTNLKRRRVLLTGLAAVPVLLTLKSQSAFAQDTPCSIILSIKLDGAYSQHPNVQVTEADITACNGTSTSTTTTTTTTAPTTP